MTGYHEYPIEALSPRRLQAALACIKREFARCLEEELGIGRVEAPMLLEAGYGLNDDLNGVERALGFSSADGTRFEVPQSLAKWKRCALAAGAYGPGEGLWADMRAIRPDEVPDETHSRYVDQWDWEVALAPGDRNATTLARYACGVYRAMSRCEDALRDSFPETRGFPLAVPDGLKLVHAEDLAREYPALSPREREHAACGRWGATFVVGIGGPLSVGAAHDGRAPDYDDWSSPSDGPFDELSRADGAVRLGLNGDIVVPCPSLGLSVGGRARCLELSSMGVRVDAAALARQLAARNCPERSRLPFHRSLLEGRLPESIGGGIGQARLCMALLGARAIGEVRPFAERADSILPEAARACPAR